MASFKLYNCDVGLKIGGVSYDFDHIQSVTIDDPETTNLIRGANAGNKSGLIYREGLKEPKKITAVIIGMSIELKAVLDAAFKDKSRVDFYVIDREDGSMKAGKNCVIQNQPQQLSLEDSPDSMNVSIMLATFDLSESHKS